MIHTRRRWLHTYVVLAIVGGLALMAGAFGRVWVGIGLALLASGVTVLVAVSLDQSPDP